MDPILNNLPESLMVAGIAALIIEVAVLGLSTFVLLFLGASLLITGLAMTFGILPETGTTALWSNAILTAFLAVVLWKPLKNMQNQVQKSTINSDFARGSFILEEDVDQTGEATRLYSGIRWKLKSEQPISKGTRVQVVKSDVGIMWVKPCEDNSGDT
ncbi:MAG: activity regulator of membrane protease YbbK [Oceanospirillaceae bacterium]|nr:activity regulator of membrane protease YbbK [Oceanospirillaceae bacterium]MBT13952.1 activity regulator of membrane protease YbbK [Oceanospirillaceae bacterium]|tara:strand:+ start:35681 stop:36154 length:474 start_codon:yes stop_codon:yes gene_type:complete